MSKTLKIVFNLSDKKTATCSVADPKDGLTKAEAQAVAEEIISKQAILADNAYPVSVKSMQIVSTDSQPLA